jgi:hypothetical protein
MAEDSNVSHAGVYVIKVNGIIDPRWMDWFNGMQLTYEKQSDGSTLSILTGKLLDQSSLHGKLRILRDLNLTLVAVERLPHTM